MTQLRFGTVMTSAACSRDEWIAKCRRAESLGYDVICASDHLNLAAPFPSMVLAAEATQRPVIGSYVINTSFHNPAVLARDVATTDQFTGGRVELGLGTGYVPHEYGLADIDFGTPGQRVDRLEHCLSELDIHFGRPEFQALQRPRPPLLVGGHGDRVLRLAARRADIVSFVGASWRQEYGRMTVVDAKRFGERIEYARSAAGARIDDIEFNVLSKGTVLTKNRREAMENLRGYGPDLTIDELLEIPTLFTGTPADIVEQIHHHREAFGLTYFTVLENDMDDFGKVIEAIR